MDQWIESYKQLNNSFRKKLVFRLGVEVGFFSEYNNTIIAMLYCLQHNIKFELYSRFANFARYDGWNDFFQPFVSVNTQDINRHFNLRYGVERVADYDYPLQSVVKPRHVAAVYKALNGITYLTQDLWAQQRDPAIVAQRFTFPTLHLQNASLVEAAQAFVRAFWKYNDQSAAAIRAIIETVPLPEQYVSIHVRAGDKSSEINAFDFAQYMALAQQFSSNKQAFVLTDDYTVVENLRQHYPDWTFYTLCSPLERGYYQDEFDKKDKEVKYQHHIRLFAELDIAAASEKFIGTYSSNIGMHMGMRIGPERCACVDFDQWVMW